MEYAITSKLRGIERGWIVVGKDIEYGKVCNVCGVMKVLGEYTPSKELYDGRMNRCKPCNAKRQSEYSKANPEIRRKSERKWREANPDKVKAMASRSRKRNIDGYRRRLQEWRAENPERNKEINQRYKQKHPERVKESQRLYTQNNPDKVKANARRWQLANPEKVIIIAANRRARERSLPNNFDKEWSEMLFKIYGGCVLTGETKDIHWDHFIPLATGKGGTTYGNMVPLQSTLNLQKGAKNPIEFLMDAGMSDQRLFDVLWVLGHFNDMNVLEYVNYVYECFEEKEVS